jgi:hypothetical protein
VLIFCNLLVKENRFLGLIEVVLVKTDGEFIIIIIFFSVRFEA